MSCLFTCFLSFFECPLMPVNLFLKVIEDNVHTFIVNDYFKCLIHLTEDDHHVYTTFLHYVLFSFCHTSLRYSFSLFTLKWWTAMKREYNFFVLLYTLRLWAVMKTEYNISILINTIRWWRKNITCLFRSTP